METRESLNDHLRAIAGLQYEKTFPLPESEVKLIEAAKNLPKTFLPQRKFKRVLGGQSLPTDTEVSSSSQRCPLIDEIHCRKFDFRSQVISTLMEYGCKTVNLLEDDAKVKITSIFQIK